MKKVGNDLKRLNAPTPHYLKKITFKKVKNNIVFTGFLLFPDSDISIESRGHANQGHFLFALWNVSFLINYKYNIGKVLARSVYVENYKEIAPDTMLGISGSIQFFEGRKRGTVKVSYFLLEEKVCKIDVDFSIIEKAE